MLVQIVDDSIGPLPAPRDTPTIVAIGDVHGGRYLVRPLIDAVLERWAGFDQLVFIGDYIDRGTDSRGVIDDLLALDAQLPGKLRFLAGNHEHALLGALDDPTSTGWLLGHEGMATIASYAPELVDEIERAITAAGPRLLASRDQRPSIGLDRAFARIPPAHLDFLRHRLERYIAVPGAVFVHAGVRPGVALAAQTDSDLFSIGRDFHTGWQGPGTVIFGHYFTGTLRDDGLARVWRGPAAVGIDTGNVATGVLTALRWPSGDLLHAVGPRDVWMS